MLLFSAGSDSANDSDSASEDNALPSPVSAAKGNGSDQDNVVCMSCDGLTDASDEEVSEACKLPQAMQNFEIPLCGVCLDDRYICLLVGLVLDNGCHK